jgi:hypothetical protein
MYTRDSSFISEASNLNLNKVFDFIILNNPLCKYTRYDVSVIVNEYTKQCKTANINWVLALSQMLHETGKLSSEWCARPRRNPAGLGVNGTFQKAKPTDTYGWYYDLSRDLWLAGFAFDNWIGEGGSVESHIAHLLLYIYKDSEMTAEQLELSRKSVGKRRLEQKHPEYRGIAKTLQGLYQTWAFSSNPNPDPKLQYPNRIAKVANELCEACK